MDSLRSTEGASEADNLSHVDQEIAALKAKIKEIEDKLRELRSRQQPPVHVPPTQAPADNTVLIYGLIERVEALESEGDKVAQKLGDHDDRLDKLEKDNAANNDKILANTQAIGGIKDVLPDKVDCDTFDHEIEFLKELLNNLGSGEKVDMQIPPPKPSISTKDANKLKEVMARIPEIEKLLKDLLERVGAAERSIGDHDKTLKSHDKTLEDILAELAKKANLKDLKDLADRLNQLERDIENIVQHISSLGKHSGGPPVALVADNSDKRLNALEKKIEELRNDLNNSLRDLSKTIDALNSELKGVKKDTDGKPRRNVVDLKKDLLKLMKKVNDLELRLDALIKLGGASSSNTATLQTSPADDEKLEELRKALSDLRNDYRNFRNEAFDKFNGIDSELDRKASKEELENLRNLLKKRLDDLENALNKTKNDLKRALRILNEKVRVSVVTL